MERAPIRLLIVDDNLETCDILENFFTLTPEIEVCGVAHDGDEALYRMGQSQPDVVLLDLIMPKSDGISVLERLSRAELPHRPRIIVTSSVGQERFTAAALSLGADYYMIKPYDLSNLHSRICMVAPVAPSGGVEPPQQPRPQPERWETVVSRSLLVLGIPAHMLGYRYCVTAVCRLLQENAHQSIVKDIYVEIARAFTTTPECVEGAIRKAIHKAWEQANASLQALCAVDRPPTNGQFLSTLAQQLRLKAQGDLG